MIIWGFKSHALKLYSPEFFDMHFERIEGVGEVGLGVAVMGDCLSLDKFI